MKRHPEKLLDQEDIEKILEVLSNGGNIAEALISGSVILTTGDENRSDVKFNYQTFQHLKEQGVIECVDTMRQGHFFYHGQVRIYKIPTSEDS